MQIGCLLWAIVIVILGANMWGWTPIIVIAILVVLAVLFGNRYPLFKNKDNKDNENNKKH